jgi:hypothetical protein
MIETITKPSLEKSFPNVPDLWIDPVTGLAVPKSVSANLQWRMELLKRAEKDSGFQSELYTASSQSLLFFVNAFVWTYRLFINNPDGSRRQVRPEEAHVPFITWEIQDEHILEIERAINGGYDLLTDKSRDMGATWDHVTAFYHKWLFEDDRSFLMISRKEDCVDSTGKKGLSSPADPGTLFGKIDYISAWLPEWMRPFHTRTTMHLVNLNNRSRIDGESANAAAGSSDRRTSILLDEMAKMAEGESIKRSTRDVTACRLANSTPDGPGTAFSNWRLSGSVKVFVLPWWEHPEKGFGRYSKEDELTGIMETRSPWFNIEETLRTPKELAIEVKMDHIGSGENFFELETIAKHKKLFASKPPVSTGYHIAFKREIAIKQMPSIIHRNLTDSIQKQFIANGPWTFFMHLIDGRPDQTLDYVFGIDIGKGMGASNSIISVGCVQLRRKVAEWASANFAPHDFALIAAASGIWFGGSQRGHRPFMIWEANGDPGIYFGKILVRELQYPNYYLDRHAVNKIRTKKPRQYGWHSSTEKKAELLGEYRRALDHGTFINPSIKALDEAETYVYLAGGAIEPASLQQESASARKTHGDRVIGDALCHKGMDESRIAVCKTLELPKNSFGGRYEAWKKQQKDIKCKRTWNLRS